MTRKHDEAEFWNTEGGERWVEHIDRLEKMLAPVSTQLLAHAAPTGGEHVLDIGCGGGATSAEIAQRVQPGGSVLGADVSEVILTVARQRYAGIDKLSFETADAGTYSFDAQHFDLMTSRFGVMFFPDPEAAFKNICRAGKRGGRIVFACWRGLAENPWMGLPVGAAFKILTPPPKPEPGAPGPFSLADPDRVRYLLENAGFTAISLTQHDESFNLGEVDAALAFMTKLGPAAEPLRDASDAEREAAIAAMRACFSEHVDGQNVLMPGSIWIVSGRVD